MCTEQSLPLPTSVGEEKPFLSLGSAYLQVVLRVVLAKEEFASECVRDSTQ